MNLDLHFSFVFVLLILGSSASPPQPSISCSDELVSFSTCLSYAAISPNNGTDSPSPKCCDDISAAFLNDSAICLCYFIRQPDILGFPLNATKVMSLTTVCLIDDGVSGDIQTLCSGSTTLPPLSSITGIAANSPPLPTRNSSQVPHVGSSNDPEPADELPTQPGSSIVQSAVSSATEINIKLSCFLMALVCISLLFVQEFCCFERLKR